jgi:hypothetical protein
MSMLGMTDVYSGSPTDSLVERVRGNICYDRDQSMIHFNVVRLNVAGDIRTYGTKKANPNEFTSDTNPFFRKDIDFDTQSSASAGDASVGGTVTTNNVFLSEKTVTQAIASAGFGNAVGNSGGVPSVDLNTLVVLLATTLQQTRAELCKFVDHQANLHKKDNMPDDWALAWNCKTAEIAPSAYASNGAGKGGGTPESKIPAEIVQALSNPVGCMLTTEDNQYVQKPVG